MFMSNKLCLTLTLFFIVVVIPGHTLGNSQVSVNRTIGPTLVLFIYDAVLVYPNFQLYLSFLILQIM